MTTIDEIMVAAYAHSAATASGRSVCPRLAAAELRSIIGYALDKARVDGAREMRGACEEQVSALRRRLKGSTAKQVTGDCAAAIRVLPLPASTVEVIMDREHGGLTFAPAKREPVRLTDEQIGAEMIRPGNEALSGFARAIEAAVWSANGLEAAR